jgi:hypothetical protein
MPFTDDINYAGVDFFAGVFFYILMVIFLYASAGFKAINELKPMLGLELTATPQVENSGQAARFTNVYR